MLSVYIAAPWKRGGDANKLALAIAGAGHEITSGWLRRSKVNLPDSYDYSAAPKPDLFDWAAEAANDLADIRESNVMVVLNSIASEGKVIEQGLAIAAGLPIILIGKRTNVFQALENYKIVSSTEEAIGCLAAIQL